jgi:glutathione peroxidase
MSFFSMLTSKDSKNNSQPLTSIYDIQINSLQGNSINLSNFKDKYLLIVNVASKCGFTPQYKELQKLHEKYKKSLIVIGVPCNQFGQQEPGEAFEIQEFCEANYGVEFLITEKIDVKGNNQHPLFKWLTDKSLNGCKDSKVKWNFQKYLINPKGNLIDYFYSTTSPISKKITKYL